MPDQAPRTAEPSQGKACGVLMVTTYKCFHTTPAKRTVCETIQQPHTSPRVGTEEQRETTSTRNIRDDTHRHWVVLGRRHFRLSRRLEFTALT